MTLNSAKIAVIVAICYLIFTTSEHMWNMTTNVVVCLQHLVQLRLMINMLDSRELNIVTETIFKFLED